jgi:hypothetical protein
VAGDGKGDRVKQKSRGQQALTTCGGAWTKRDLYQKVLSYPTLAQRRQGATAGLPRRELSMRIARGQSHISLAPAVP